MNSKNADVRLKAAGAGLKLWQVADKLGYSDSHFSKKLRFEFTNEEKKRALEAIEELCRDREES